MTYQDLCRRLAEAGIEDAEWEAVCLLEHFCHADRVRIRADVLHDYAEPTLHAAVERRLLREPLQYILGEWSFYNQTYEVSPHCLIPRSDTERLVEEAIRLLPSGASFADLCTGSGCIAISVLAERPDTTALAIDKFEETLALAVRNAVRNHVDSRLMPICADVLVGDCLSEQPMLDAVFCNPPYIATGVLPSLSLEVQAEPIAALDGGTDGLLFYRHLIGTLKPHLKPDGFLLFEIGYDQANAVVELGRQHGYSGIRVLRDYGGNDRVVVLSQSQKNL